MSESISLPRGHHEAFCTNCGLAFGLVSDSPLRHTCLCCYVKLGRPALECDHCHKAIPPGNPCHIEIICVCADCCRWYFLSCNTKAWSRKSRDEAEAMSQQTESTT